MKKRIKLTVALFCIASLSACSTIGKLGSKEAKADDAPVVDITRPPEMIVNTKDDAVEGNPDETVSFDEWKKKTEGQDE